MWGIRQQELQIGRFRWVSLGHCCTHALSPQLLDFSSICHHPLYYHLPPPHTHTHTHTHTHRSPRLRMPRVQLLFLYCGTLSTKDSSWHAKVQIPSKGTHRSNLSLKDHWAGYVRRLQNKAYPLCFIRNLILIKLSRTHAKTYLPKCLQQFLIKLETIFLEDCDLGLSSTLNCVLVFLFLMGVRCLLHGVLCV